MKVRLDKVLFGINGQPIRMPDGESATLKTIATEALLAVLEEERGIPGKEKYTRFNLSHKIYNGGALVDLTDEETEKIKELIGKCFNTLVVGAAFDAIEDVNRNYAKTQQEAATLSL